MSRPDTWWTGVRRHGGHLDRLPQAQRAQVVGQKADGPATVGSGGAEGDCLAAKRLGQPQVAALEGHPAAGLDLADLIVGFDAGAELLTVLAGIPRADIPTVAGPAALEPRYVNHHLTVNRCLLAIRSACRAQPGAALCEWTADPHARVRYRVGRTWPTVRPDAVAELEVDGQRRWIYLEADRSAAELRRYGLKLRRYARFYLSGRRRRAYAQFPETRIVTAHRPRVQRMLAEVEAARRGFGPAEVPQLDAGLGVAVTWEAGIMANPSGAVWVSVHRPAREEPLLASAVVDDHGPARHATPQAREG